MYKNRESRKLFLTGVWLNIFRILLLHWFLGNNVSKSWQRISTEGFEKVFLWH